MRYMREIDRGTAGMAMLSGHRIQASDLKPNTKSKKPKKDRHYPTPEEDAKVRELYVDEGKNLTEISKIMDMATSTLINCLDREGVDRRGRGRNKLL